MTWESDLSLWGKQWGTDLETQSLFCLCSSWPAGADWLHPQGTWFAPEQCFQQGLNAHEHCKPWGATPCCLRALNAGRHAGMIPREYPWGEINEWHSTNPYCPSLVSPAAPGLMLYGVNCCPVPSGNFERTRQSEKRSPKCTESQAIQTLQFSGHCSLLTPLTLLIQIIISIGAFFRST